MACFYVFNVKLTKAKTGKNRLAIFASFIIYFVWLK